MQRGGHVHRFVVAVGTLNRDEAGVRISAHHGQKICEPGAAETADDIPTFHADVPRILNKFRQGLYGCQIVSTWLLDFSADRKGPAVEVHFGVVHVKCVESQSSTLTATIFL